MAGLSEADAVSAVSDAGLDPETVNEAGAQPAGQAIRTEPPAGTSLLEGSKVTVVISSGPDTPGPDPTPGEGAGGGQGGGGGQAGGGQAGGVARPPADLPAVPGGLG